MKNTNLGIEVDFIIEFNQLKIKRYIYLKLSCCSFSTLALEHTTLPFFHSSSII